MSTNAVKAVLEELVPQFERATRHKAMLQFAPAADLKARIEKGERVDVAILTAAAIDELIKGGKLAAATRADLARSGAGIAIRKGAPKPGIATVDQFKRALLAAKSIAYVGSGTTGDHMRKIFEQLGIAETMDAKTRLLSGRSAAEAVAAGEAELGFTQIAEILPVGGAALVGPLPQELQLYTVLSGAVGATLRDGAASQAFLQFVTTPAAAAVIQAKGMEAFPYP